ncbi:MAG TPA: YcxB family protein, partial [Usitatibacter sp.]|nr:YcxB family protein [Usitatibacter sp.]
MKFTYAPGFRDNLHGLMLGFWGSPGRIFRSVAMCAIFGLFAAAAIRNAGLPWPRAILTAIAAAVSWGVLFTAGFGSAFALLLTRRQRAIGPAEIVVSEEGLRRSTARHAVKLGWDEVSHVRETRRAFLLYDGEHPVFAVEKSAIPSRSEMAALRRFLQERKPTKGVRHA